MVELTVLGISTLAKDGLPLLLLHAPGMDRVLVMRIGPMEAAAIAAALGKESSGAAARAPGALFPRPQTHDLLLAAIRALRGSVVCVDIQHYIDGAFIAEAVIDHPMGRSRLDCRPSDGVALALRCAAPVRASSAVLSRAGEGAAALKTLADGERLLLEAKLAESAMQAQRTGPGPNTGSGPDSGRIPESVKEALAARENAIDHEARQRIISVARKMLEDEAAGHKDAAPAEADRPDQPRSEISLPRIRVSLVRQKRNGETEIVDEYQVPAQGLPREAIAGLGISGREAAALNAASDEERWTILLKMLTPETKVPM